MDTLSGLISLVPSGYTWLLREDEQRGYFAHIYAKGKLHLVKDIGYPNNFSFISYGDTPEKAMSNALYELVTV